MGFEGLAMTETSEIETLAPQRPGYWSDHENHPYRRMTVESLEEFCGWPALKKLISYLDVPIQKTFFVTTFQSGGRVSEVLLLKKENFNVLPDDGVVKVSGMRCLKRYRKIDRYIDCKGHARWHTELKYELRKTFAIDRSEPFTPILERHLESITDPENYLFPTSQRHGKQFLKTHVSDESLKVNGQVPYSRVWAYQIIRSINDNLPRDLKGKLGLLKPQLDEKGKKIKDELHLWLHWFRSQRASQLVADYNFDVLDLVKYFTWLDLATATRYANKGWRGLTAKMKNAHAVYT